MNEQCIKDAAHELVQHPFVYHYKHTSWCHTVHIFLSDGSAMCRLYVYDDVENQDYVYLDTLSVNERIRKQSIGTKLQEIREDIGRKIGAKYAMLFVKKETWMYDWYKRRGYLYHSEYCEQSDWLIKEL